MNRRIFYPTHAVAIKENDGTVTFVTADLVHGVQSVSMNTNFNIDRTNELGTQNIYSNVEGIPNIEASISKVLDGYPTPYLLATQKAVEPTLIARSAVKCDVGLAIHNDTKTYASGEPLTVAFISGAFVDSVSYNFDTASNFREETSFVANNKLWWRNDTDVVPSYGNSAELKPGFPAIVWNANMKKNDSPLAAVGVARSQHFQFFVPTSNVYNGISGALTTDANGAINHPDITVMPTEVAGFNVSGLNVTDSTGDFAAHISSFTASVSLGREDILELGRRDPYFRPANFPVEVTSEIQATAGEGDLVSAMSNGIFGTTSLCGNAGYNTKDRTIRVVLCEGLRLYLGTKNRLQSVGYSGGDADGGNVSISYSYTNFNDFTVMHSGDIIDNATGLWANRASYLTE